MSDGITYAILACYVDKGMKSKGSKSLIEFGNQKLLEYQIDKIKKANKNSKSYDIIVITNFEYTKIARSFHNQVYVYNLEDGVNPIAKACDVSKYKDIFFIDYGCLYTKEIVNIRQTKDNDGSVVFVTKNKNVKLDIGVLLNDNNTAKHLFFDLHDKKFTNMFFLCENDVNHIKATKKMHQENLMYFEIINYLIEYHKSNMSTINIDGNMFMYFNHMRQKNGISKFISKNPN
jgi:hypothetical protein